MTKKRERAAKEFSDALRTLKTFGFVAMELYHGGPKAISAAGHDLFMEDIAGAAFDVGMEVGFAILPSRIKVKVEVEKTGED